MKIRPKDKECKHNWQIMKRPERIEFTLGEFIAICKKCFKYRWIQL